MCLQRVRLGFLSDGAFFGEAAVLADESGRELRRRTLKAVTDSELCYITRDDIMALRREYPELDARLKRFVNVGNIRLSKKGVCGSLFPELSPAVTGMSKSQAEREQRRLVGEYASTYNDMQQMMKTINEDGVSADTGTVSLQQLGVGRAKQTQQKFMDAGTAPTATSGPLVPTSDLGDLPPLPNAQTSPEQHERFQAVESQVSILQRTVDRELGVLHSKSDSMQDSLRAIMKKLDEMGGGS